MSIQFRVEVGGIEEFAEKMRTLDQYTQAYVQDALNEVGQLVASRARQIAPVRTGLLISSIFAEIIYKWVVKIACRVPYALFQELGTRYIQPRFFLTRALEENRFNFLTIIAAGLQRAADEAST